METQCTYCNNRRCRFRQNKPKRLSKRAIREQELLSRYRQLELFSELGFPLVPVGIEVEDMPC